MLSDSPSTDVKMFRSRLICFGGSAGDLLGVSWALLGSPEVSWGLLGLLGVSCRIEVWGRGRVEGRHKTLPSQFEKP